MKWIFVSLIVTTTLMGCAPQRETPETLNMDTSHSIIGGEDIHERASAASKSVVFLELTNRVGQVITFCTGTLIAPQTVLTAGHCFDSKVVPNLDGFNVVFTSNYVPFNNYIKRRGLRRAVHKYFNSNPGYYDHDIAIGVFSGDIPAGYSPVNIDTNTSANYSASVVYAYGFGRSKDYTDAIGSNPMSFMGQLRRGAVQIDSNYNRHPDRYWTTGRGPVFICQGDSGGPQFYHNNGVLKVIGVNSAVYTPDGPDKNLTCKAVAQITKVAPFAEWIRKTRAKLLQ